MADLVKRLRMRAKSFRAVDAGNTADLLDEAADRISALEAEASKGERRGLEQALLICRDRAAIESERATDAQKPNTRSAALWASFKLRCAANDIAALIPEAPVREAE